MRVKFFISLVVMVCGTALAALAQENAFVLLDTRHKLHPCVTADINVDVENCPLGGFLVQGQRNELRVIHRRFLTNYTFFIDNVTQVTNFPIEDLNEAANLSLTTPTLITPASKGAAPKGVSANGSIPIRAAQDLIAELLNPGTASNPATELASDFILLKHDIEKVRSDREQFQATWVSLEGTVPPGASCTSAFGAPTLQTAVVCLADINMRESTGPFLGAGPFTNEDEFRTVIVRDNDAIAMVTALNGVLGVKVGQLNNQLSSLQGDLATLRADANIFAGNVAAADDANGVAVHIGPPAGSFLTRAQIKAKVLSLYGQGTPSTLDPAEINQLANEIFNLMRAGPAPAPTPGVLAAGRGALANVIAQAKTDVAIAPAAAPTGNFSYTCDASPPPADGMYFGCIATFLDARYAQAQHDAETTINRELVEGEDSVNRLQSTVLARANYIYDKSEVCVPLEKAIDLSAYSGNLRVYGTIYETETFPRFTIPPVSSANQVAGATPVVLPTAAGTPPPAPTPPPTPAAHPSGNPIPVRDVEVHDLYHATMVAAFAFSQVHDINLVSNPIVTGTAVDGSMCSSTDTCTQLVVQKNPIHHSVIMGMALHPLGYDTFPGASNLWHHPGQIGHFWGLFGGLSVQNLNDYYAGVNLQIAHGVQIIGGYNAYQQTFPNSMYMQGVVYPGTPNFGGPTHWTTGGFGAIGLNLSIFRKAFGAVTGVGSQGNTTTAN